MAEFFYVLTENTDLLVADDDPIMREFASVYLSSPTATVTTATDGRDALALLKDRRFDLLLLDLDMPVMNGFEVLETLRADHATAGLPIIVITGREDIVSIDRAYALGATSFINKPVNWRILAYQVRYVLRANAIAASQAEKIRGESTNPGGP